MEFIYGLLTSVVFFAAFLSFFYMGYRYGKKAPAPKPIDDEEKRKTEKFNQHFKALFAYDVDTAIAKKKVK